ncbi:MAG TPA: sensor domain-containing diguanylate cyclase [Frankiaceae bacterium]|nr:sensor domain-containing diguanylate cyclase [Frankiaceae bacterium]
MTGLAALTGSSAISTWRDRQAAIKVRADVAAPSALMAARALVVNEGVASIAVANSRENRLGVARLKELSGVDFAAALRTFRPQVEHNATLLKYPSLRADLQSLLTLRHRLDAGTASYVDVLHFYTSFTAHIDAIWQRQLADLRRTVTSSSHGTGLLAERISVLPTAYAVLTTAVRRAADTNSLLRPGRSSTTLHALLEAGGEYAADAKAVTGRLGPKAQAAWDAMERDPAVARFAHVITQTEDLALQGKPSPLATNVVAHARSFADGERWLDDLDAVVQGASADVRAVANREAQAAEDSFQLEMAIFLLSVLFAAAAAVLLTRSVVQPLRRLSDNARKVAEGNFALPAVVGSGPREVVETVQAVDDMTAVLAAVESFTVTLAQDPTSPSLDVPLPGRTGLALQTTLDRLRESVREAERQRVRLHEVATRDGLTGLLNREAALDAVTKELTRARRDHTTVMLLFIDLDGLKAINDTHGHKAGDDAIQLAAHALRGAASEEHIVARLGGDEFLIAGGPVHDHGDVQALADRLHRSVAESALEADRLSVALRCSIGVALSEPGDNVESLIQKADQALYFAKNEGRNQTRWHALRSEGIDSPHAQQGR